MVLFGRSIILIPFRKNNLSKKKDLYIFNHWINLRLLYYNEKSSKKLKLPNVYISTGKESKIFRKIK